jgi:hypothetical protein
MTTISVCTRSMDDEDLDTLRIDVNSERRFDIEDAFRVLTTTSFL